MSNETKLDQQLLESLKRHGDRTSSFLTSYPGFKSFGPIRFVETASSWIAATEPLAHAKDKAEAFTEFVAEASKSGKATLMVPVTQELSAELVKRGCHRLQVGAEPIFELEKYFGGPDPLALLPPARSLAKRGFKVEEMGEITESLRAELDTLLGQWLASRQSEPMQFLNQVNPWLYASHKKLFVLKQGSKIVAFLSAVPIYARQGYFFADYIRAPNSRAGTIELLFIESMRLLAAQGYKEVSLGLCPLAKLRDEPSHSARERLILRVMNLAYNRLGFPYGYRSVCEFKSKFEPTRWDLLYLVSPRPIGAKTLSELAHAHFPKGWLKAWVAAIARKELKPGVNLGEFKTPALSLSIGVALVVLHAFKTFAPSVQAFYESHGFAAASPTLSGWLLGPLFHNTHYHLAGDISTFWIFGAAVELVMGRLAFLMVMSAGLWATNPATLALLKPLLTAAAPAELSRLARELDYGSSNAIYAFVGALAALLRDHRLLIVPFALNGLFLCLARESWLSIHHLMGLAMGFVLGQVWLARSRG